MDDPAIAQVRRFNRVVTQRIGALDDRFLSRERSLGESRLLWEVGPAGADLRALRARLGLDAGYLSRLLQSLERAGLVRVAPKPSDRRVRMLLIGFPALLIALSSLAGLWREAGTEIAGARA